MICDENGIEKPSHFTVKVELVEHSGAPKYGERDIKGEPSSQSISHVNKEPPFSDTQTKISSHQPVNQSPHNTKKVQGSLPFVLEEVNYKIYNSADVIKYTPENALQEGVAMIRDVNNSLKGIDLGSKLRKDVWMKEIETLMKQRFPKTMIAVCGPTGAGKSSLLNAVLDDNIVPTSGMQACTAVITEISYHKKTHIEADVSFLNMDEWKTELESLLHDMVDEDGNPRHLTDIKSVDGIAWSKVHAVYPSIEPQQLLGMTPDQIILSQPESAEILGTKKRITAPHSNDFSQQIGKYIESKEGDAEPALWPLIRLVQVQCHSKALSKGAVLVDLPGTADANAARNSIAKDYMKKCECIWIVAPTDRAPSNGIARDLLGDAFKTQLLNGNYGGNYITFIATKTDDVSCSETIGRNAFLAEDPVLQEIERKIYETMEKRGELELQKASVEKRMKALKAVKKPITEECTDARKHLRALRNGVEYVSALKRKKGKGKADGGTTSRKRKASSGLSFRPTKCQKSSPVSSVDEGDKDGDDDFLSDETASDSDSDSQNNSRDHSDRDCSSRGGFDAGSDASGGEDSDDEDGDTMGEDGEQVTEASLRERIKMLDEQLKPLKKELKDLAAVKKTVMGRIDRQKRKKSGFQREKNAFCSLKRNEKSRHMLKEAFRQGLQQKDEEMRNTDTHNFSVPLRDYQSIDLPVFACSSRDYVRITKQVEGDGDPICFTKKKDTGIPDLQQWCHELTVSSRERVARKFLAHLSTFFQSILSYVSDTVGVSAQDRITFRDKWETKENRVTSAELQVDGNPMFTFNYDDLDEEDPQFYTGGLQAKQSRKVNLSGTGISARLQMELEDVAKGNVVQLKEKIRARLGEKCTNGTRKAQDMAVVNSDNFAASMHWQTYRAILKRFGEFREHDLNLILSAPLTKEITSSWAGVFESDLFGPMEESINDKIEMLIKEIEDTSPAGLKGHCKAQGQLSVKEAKVSVKALMDKVQKQMSIRQKDISRCIVPHVRDALLDGYEAATKERGKGSVDRQKGTFHDYVEGVKDHVFDSLSESILNRLDDATSAIGVSVDRALKSITKKVEVSMSVLWENSKDDVDQRRLRKELVQKISELLKLVQMWQDADSLRFTIKATKMIREATKT